MSLYVKPGGKPDWAVRAEGWTEPTIADLVDALHEAGAGKVVADVGYGLQIDSEEGDKFLVVRIEGEET